MTRRLILLAMLWICLPAALLGLPGDATAQSPAAAPPKQSPSDPPFWARPRPAQPQPDCACDEEAKKPGSTSQRGASTWTGVAIGVAGLAFVLLLWRWMRTQPESPAAARLSSPAARARTLPASGTASALPPPVAPASVPEYLPAQPDHELLELGESGNEDDAQDSHTFYTEVAASLAEAIAKNPGRQDLWRKLFEVYRTAGMSDEFVNLAYAFLEQSEGRGSQYWGEIGALGYSLLPEHELFREFGSKPAIRRTLQFRRFYDRKLDQGALFRTQEKLEAGFNRVRASPEFKSLLRRALTDGVQRPSPLVLASELEYGMEGARLYLKREDRRRGNDDILINALGQALLAQHLGCKQLLAATHDGIHGLAAATVAARLGLDCVVYIAEDDFRRHYARVLGMRKLGAQVRPVHVGADSRFNDARLYALTGWIEDPGQSQYVSGLSNGPQPFPMIVGEFQAEIGVEALAQMTQLTGRPPGAILVHARDGYFGMGLLRGFLDQPEVKLYYVDAPDPDQANEDRSRALGHLFLREHRWLRDTGRINYLDGNDQEAMRVVEQFHIAGTALVTNMARALAHARLVAQQSDPQDTVLVMYSSQEEAGTRVVSSD